MKIFPKLFLLVGGTIISLVSALTLAGHFIISSTGEQRVQEQALAYSQAVQQEVTSMSESMLSLGKMLQLDSGFGAMLANKEVAGLKKVAQALAAEPLIDLVTVCDTEGRVVVRGHSDKSGDLLGPGRLSALVPLKEKRTVVGMEPGNVVRLTLASGVPIFNEDQLVGAVIIGSDLSSGFFVNRMKKILGAESTIFLDDVRIATTIMHDGKPVIDTTLDNPVIYKEVIEEGKTFLGRNMISGMGYSTIYWPWKDLEGKIRGMFFMGISLSSIADSERTVLVTFALAGLLLGSILLGIGALVARAIVRPLHSTVAYAEAVSNGDFNKPLEVESRDEVGMLAKTLRNMVANLQEKIVQADQQSATATEQAQKASAAMQEAQEASREAEAGRERLSVAATRIEEVVGQLSSSASDLSSRVSSASHSAESQCDQVVGVVTAMEEMNSTVLEVSRSAGTASEASERAKNRAEEGENIVRRSIEAIGTVQGDTKDLEQGMQALGQKTEAIGAVMNVINDIADQTNLLALNAAIEAARAGEAGRGFAVVADEVRKLAEKTMQATKEVGDTVEGIQHSTRSNIAVLERTSDNLHSTGELVRESGETLASIVEEAAQVADQVQAIATAVEQQSATSEEINRAVVQIKSIADETRQNMEEASRALAGLSEQERVLSGLIEEMKDK